MKGASLRMAYYLAKINYSINVGTKNVWYMVHIDHFLTAPQAWGNSFVHASLLSYATLLLKKII